MVHDPRAELILHGGVVHALDPSRRAPVSAIAFAAGQVLALGDDEEVLARRGPRTRCLALEGRTVVPGFCDSHVHLAQHALAERGVDASGCRTAEEVAARVAQHAARRPAGSVLLGRGFDPNRWGAWPERHLLDDAASGRPVVLFSKDMHSAWLSSAALARAGIDASSPDPAGGRIRRDARGEPTGVLHERALEAVERSLPEPDEAEVAAALEEAIPRAWAEGLTTIHEILDSGSLVALRAFARLRGEGRLGLRVRQYLPADALAAWPTIEEDDRLRLGGIKLFADGALGSRTAWMLEPYEGSEDRGVAALDLEELRTTLASAERAGVACAVHAIGDRAVREVLVALEALRERRAGRPGPRHRIEHLQLLHPADLPRLSPAGAVISMQPIHATSDLELALHHWGRRRSELAYAWRSVLESGATLCFGSDAPVEPLSVLAGIHAAVTRRRPDGSPGPEGFVPAQRLSVGEALAAYTLGAALATGEADRRGTLAPGRLGDAVVLSRDPFTLPPEAILETRVDATALDGRLVYERAAAL